MLVGFAPEVSPELPLEELLLLDLPEHESSDLLSLLSSFLSQPVESLVLPELELLDEEEELLELLDEEEELPELSLPEDPLELDEEELPELSPPEDPLELSPLLDDELLDELLDEVAVVVSPPQLSSSFVVELVVPVLDAPQPSSATTSSSPSSS